jgi:2,4-dienoyl-CoA reductase-like NADH-dependent reductase (Old Yellow Enzyme family)
MKKQSISSLHSVASFSTYSSSLNITLPHDSETIFGKDSPLAQSYYLDNHEIGNRYCALPMEGWDATPTGQPSELTQRRWENFGRSGAKLIWGGEAVAVRYDGRGSPNQLYFSESNLPALQTLRDQLVAAHQTAFGVTHDLLVGIQLTHSGRVSRPTAWNRPEPKILYHHPILDQRLGLTADYPVLTDEELDEIVRDFIQAAVWSKQLGFHFVDIKHCHGYLSHELLSAKTRPGRYGGSFENRTRFLREVVKGIRAQVPDLLMGVRLSAFDFVPYRIGKNGVGEPESVNYPYLYAFGSDDRGSAIDLTEPVQFLQLLEQLQIPLVCITGGGSYNPHVVRPSSLPQLGSYSPPEDPLVGVARHIAVTSELKARFPDLCIVGSAYSYLQDYLPHVAQAIIRAGCADFIGLGRMLLSYPTYPRDLLTESRSIESRQLCRTCSDCSTAPRYGLVSGCYLFDSFYKQRPEAKRLRRLKQETA